MKIISTPHLQILKHTENDLDLNVSSSLFSLTGRV